MSIQTVVWDGTSFIGTWRASTEHQRTADQYFVWLTTLMQAKGLSHVTIDDVVISSTVPRVVFNLRVLCDRYFNSRPLSVGKRDAVVVDFGTATNFDVVAEDGAYVGGVISPGVNLSLEALAAGAAALPHVDISRPEKVIGTNTVGAIQSGVFWGYSGLIEGIVARIQAEYGKKLTVIATGGLAPLFAQGDIRFDHIDDDLTIHGLTVIHDFNKDNK